jgi:putative flippase GtrA
MLLSLLKSRAFALKQTRFALVAGGITLFDLCLCPLLCMVAPRATAFSVSYGIALCLRFWLDRNFTFTNKSGDAVIQLLKYTLSCLISFSLGLLVFCLGNKSGLSPFLAKLVSLPLVTIFSYLLFERFVFRSRGKNFETTAFVLSRDTRRSQQPDSARGGESPLP